jgi:2',3'-cyclic-nucleotide 2'-phosphodiesterase (5'-nucleotidase family)
MTTKIFKIFVCVVILSLALPLQVFAQPQAAPASPVTFTILHTNDFHGQLQAADADPNKISTPGMARTAKVINDIRAANTLAGRSTLLVDAGDEMQGSLLSNLGDGTPTGKGIPTIATFNEMNYDVATFGNHEFDWGQVNLQNRMDQADYPFVTANIVKNDTGNCSTAGWEKPDFADAPYFIKTIGDAPNQVKVGFIGLTTGETPTITVATATAGLCFKDPTASILNYYDQMKSDGADVIVVLSHLGYADGGYGYGIPVYGDQTLATNLINAGKPVNLIIGGHSHTSVAAPGTTVTVSGKTGSTLVVQSAYNGRRVGQADITVGADGSVSMVWKVTVWMMGNATAIPVIPSVWRTYTSSSVYSTITDVSEDSAVKGVIDSYATDPDYLALVNTPVGYSAVDLGRSNTSDNMMGSFIDDAIYNYLNTDAEPANDVDLFFNNAGGIRTDWCYVGGVWATAGCTPGTHAAGLLTYGHMFTVLPFGNATAVGKMTGDKILEVINYAPNVAGMIQPAGLKYKYFSYKDANPGPQPYAWGAYDVTVYNKVSHAWEPLDLKKTYNVGTNEFLAPAGGDGYSGFKYMTNITYWGDMLNAVNAYVGANYGTPGTAYAGPNGDGFLDGRIIQDGDGDFVFDPGEIVPITILHHNDSHGNLVKGTYVGYPQLAFLIKQERLHNPGRTLLLDGGDAIQGDAMMYYFKSSYSGFAADGTPLAPSLQTNPMMAVLNSMNYDAFVLGNHEFNYGSDVFKGIMGQATFPILGANVVDSGAYGLSAAQGGAGVKPYIEKTLDGVKVAILGITNHRVPNYELPSNIVGLTFSDPLVKAQDLANTVRSTNDLVIALTHIGFTENPASVEVDANVDTNMAKLVTGIDAIIGSHSHTNPATGFGAYKYLPSIVANPDGKPVIINQAYRYNNTLGEIVIGMRSKVSGGYEVVSETGRYLSAVLTPTPTTEDAATKAIVDPYAAALSTYNNTTLGQTTTPIDTTNAYIGETNAANLQAEASVAELVNHSIEPDFHLSGAMTQSSPKILFPSATGGSPATVKVSDMFTLMPYENSLVVLNMNGPQLKAVLERAYRNYYYYKYVPGYGGYSYYTTCMLDTNAGNTITYNDLYPALPNGNNVVSLNIGGTDIDFSDAATYYKVSTVNYLAAGSCNFNNSGVSLWPLDQIANDTQYYVRDAVIDYIKDEGTVSPAIEGRLSFIADTAAPVITINAPIADIYGPLDSLTIDFTAVDTPAGIKSVVAHLDSTVVTDGQLIDLTSLSQGDHTLTVDAVDKLGQSSTKSVTFTYDSIGPVITITSPKPITYGHPEKLPLTFSAADSPAGVDTLTAKLDGVTVIPDQVIDLYTLKLGIPHTLVVNSTDTVGNPSTASVTFNITATIQSLKASVNRFYAEGKITKPTTYKNLLKFLDMAQSALNAGKPKVAVAKIAAFITETYFQSGRSINPAAAKLLVADAVWVMSHLPLVPWK